jgi:hypothetical protein
MSSSSQCLNKGVFTKAPFLNTKITQNLSENLQSQTPMGQVMSRRIMSDAQSTALSAFIETVLNVWIWARWNQFQQMKS